MCSACPARSVRPGPRWGHDAVIRPHLAAQPRAEPRTGERVCRPGDLPVIGPCDDVASVVAVALRIWLSFSRGAGLVGLPAQAAYSDQAAPAAVILRGEHVFHDACSRLCGLRKHPGGCNQPA